MMRMVFFFFLVGACSALAVESKFIVVDDFENGLGSGWEVREFQGQTQYDIAAEGDNHYLRARAAASASGLFMETEYDLKDYPVLSWRWKVDGVLDKGDARTKAGDDYPARIYVVFPHWLVWKTRSINYIWANKLEKGSMVPSSYTGNSIMIAVESGEEKVGQWLSEERNVLDDYRRAFGETPPEVGAIAIMTDSDNTGATASASYDDILILSP